MKALNYILLGFLSVLSLNGIAQEYDDIYYNADDRVYDQNNANNSVINVPESEYGSNGNARYSDGNPSETEVIETEDGTTIVNNYYNGDNYDFDTDDYYDYAYSSRIRRFHRPIATYSYYDPFYTNMYWYNYDPFFYGSSIYLSYNFWRPRPWRFNAGWGWNSWNAYNNFSWGYNFGWSPGWSGYYASSFVNPWGFNNWGFNNNPWGYHAGYCAGFSNGYNLGYNNFYYDNSYYNSFDANSVNNHYYGHRSNTTSNTNYSHRGVGEAYVNATGKKGVNTAFASKDIAAATRSVNVKPKTVGTVKSRGTSVNTPRKEVNAPRNYSTTTPVSTTPKAVSRPKSTAVTSPASPTRPRTINSRDVNRPSRSNGTTAPRNVSTPKVVTPSRNRNTSIPSGPRFEPSKSNRSYSRPSNGSYNRSSSPSSRPRTTSPERNRSKEYSTPNRNKSYKKGSSGSRNSNFSGSSRSNSRSYSTPSRSYSRSGSSGSSSRSYSRSSGSSRSSSGTSSGSRRSGR